MFSFKVDELYSSLFASIGLSNAQIINIHIASFATLQTRAVKDIEADKKFSKVEFVTNNYLDLYTVYASIRSEKLI